MKVVVRGTDSPCSGAGRKVGRVCVLEGRSDG